jgi:hypothetical protein
MNVLPLWGKLLFIGSGGARYSWKNTHNTNLAPEGQNKLLNFNSVKWIYK